MKSYPNAILVITHDRYFLDNISTKTFELDKGNIYEYQGNYSYFLEKKIEREANEAARYLKEKKLYKKELEWIRSGVKARTTKQQARINRFEQLEDKLDNTQISNNDMSINLNNKRLGKQVFEIENISKKYNDKQIINKLDLIITNKARIGIIGKNGVGKSTFLNILSDDTKVDSGNIKKGETVKIAYYNQFSYDMDENKRIINYIRESAEIIHNSDGSVTSAAQLLEQFLFPMHTHGTLIKKLSGGEKRRLYLLKLLMEQPNVLLLDEPTNDLDTQTLTILEEYLENFSGAVITVSHDRYFLDKAVSELLVFKGDANIIKFTGNYSEYISSGGTLSDEKEESFNNKKESNYARNNKKVKMTYNEKREWENIEKEIEILEDNLSSIEAKMVEEATDFVKLNELELERKSIKEKLDLKLERWEYLSELADSI
ncbi:ABC-F family ATP-binding cassette domain-containing protein [Gemelliphila palaticanis]|uniref:ABC-F family ATP-binding cassette domain-containing protein n=1 Tax=Gemelliphila palaticanis TaxID=81950 RepID=UPI003F6A16D2